MTKKRDIRILLDNIRSVHNAGSIFRTAECAGVSKIYCIGTTPVPVDRFGRKRKDFSKVALGAEDMVAWEYSDSAASVTRKLKKEGFQIIAVEQDGKSTDHRRFKARSKALIILGNEVEGVSRSTLELADAIVEIQLKGKKESLNVSVAAGIVLFSSALLD